MSKKFPLYSKKDERRRIQPHKGNAEGAARTPFRRDFARLIHCPAFRRLQGKTQLLPNHEHDFFRNRLTHSLEVAQIAKSIATKLNADHSAFSKQTEKIDLDIVEFAALAHDLGHPPFGHIGEEALDELMSEAGGFEGNAQTLRIVGTLEKKELKPPPGAWVNRPASCPTVWKEFDRRLGLNLTFRSMASILKYDHVIPEASSLRGERGVQKGYYYHDRGLVQEIKKNVLGPQFKEVGLKFRTIECSIMDVADDIGYSTYDLEDVLKSGLIDPIGFILKGEDEELMKEMARKVNDGIKKYYPDVNEEVDEVECKFILFGIFSALFDMTEEENGQFNKERRHVRKELRAMGLASDEVERIVRKWDRYRHAAGIGLSARDISANGYYRSRFTSVLVDSAIRNIEVIMSNVHPALHQARMNLEDFKRVELLKRLNFALVIKSPRLKMIEYRGKEIVHGIFEALNGDEGSWFLPADFKCVYDETASRAGKMRVTCDFIAGMTDRHALEFHDRLKSTSPSMIYKEIG